MWYGYEVSKYNEDVFKFVFKYIGYMYGCLLLMFEMLFKDNVDLFDVCVGWDGVCSVVLGVVMLQVILEYFG